MPTIALARHAMATRFELVLHGERDAALRAAGEEALAEIDRLENQLSLYRPGSEIAQLNARAAREAVRVSPEVFALLQQAAALTTITEGAFDITIAPLVRCWGFMESQGRQPAPAELAAARDVVGMHHVQFDAPERTIRFTRPGVMLDLGAIGKGYAIERGVEILRDAGVTSALFHGGTSTIYALGQPPDADA
jgi:thiamine biosynthesis lipoprotein